MRALVKERTAEGVHVWHCPSRPRGANGGAHSGLFTVFSAKERQHSTAVRPTAKNRINGTPRSYGATEPQRCPLRWVETPTCLVTTAGAAAWGGALGWIIPGEDLPKVRFPVARAMIKCAKNTIETVWWEIDESLFFSPCRKSEARPELPQTEPSDAQCADTWAHPAPPRVAAPRHTTLTPFPRRMCLQAGGKLPCTAQTCLAFESKMQQ